MAVLKTRDVIKALTKKGFRSIEGDHTFLILYTNGIKTSIRTKVSRGSREIGDSLINIMASQLKLDKRGFKELIDCQKSEEDYIQQLKKERLIIID